VQRTRRIEVPFLLGMASAVMSRSASRRGDVISLDLADVDPE
jgi:hypothetical protein